MLWTPRRTSKPSDFSRWFPQEDELEKLSTDERFMRLQLAFEAFLLEAVVTIDEHNRGARLPLPIYGQMEYLRVAIQLLIRYRKLYWLKSRKVSATWLVLSFLLWECMRLRDQLCGWVTQKEEDGKNLISRYLTGGLVETLPDWTHNQFSFAPSRFQLTIEKFQGQPWGSIVKPYPAGADQLRQFGHSKAVIDEAHTIDDLEELLGGTTPGLRAAEGKDGGQLILIGVGRRGSHFGKLLGAQREEARRLAMERISRPPDMTEEEWTRYRAA